MFNTKIICAKIRKFIIKYHFYLSLIILFFYLSPYLILWKKTPVRIHDNLDSNVVWWKILAESGKIFAGNHATIPNMMSGLPRLSYGSEFSLMTLLFYFFPPFVAYVINEFLIHIFAFIGMYLLLKNHFRINHGKLVNIIIIDGVSLCFAFLPFWPPGGLSIAGIPLTLYAFLNIRFYKSTKRDWIILTFIPFYSFFEFSYIFFIAIIFLIFLKDWLIKHNFNKKFFLALLYFALLCLIIENRLILSMFFDKSYISHRYDREPKGRRLFFSIWMSIDLFLKGHQVAASAHTFIMVYSVSIIFITLIIFKKEDFKEIKPKIWLLIKMLILSGVISVIYGFKEWNMLSNIRNKYPILIAFNWDRFYTLYPLIWYIIFAISLDISFFYIENLKIMQKSLKKSNKNQSILHIKIGKIAVIFFSILIGFQGIYNICFEQAHQSTNNCLYLKIIHGQDYISYEEYYAEEQFNEIKNDLELPQEDYRIGCIGFDPAVALYNGFYTIDGYNPNYPKEYKERFRKLISKELEKNAELRKHFDNFGSRCYIYVAELGFKHFRKMYKWKDNTIENLELNVNALEDLEVDYIFSSVIIENYHENNLNLFNVYNHEDSAWKIFVYKVI